MIIRILLLIIMVRISEIIHPKQALKGYCPEGCKPAARYVDTFVWKEATAMADRSLTEELIYSLQFHPERCQLAASEDLEALRDIIEGIIKRKLNSSFRFILTCIEQGPIN